MESSIFSTRLNELLQKKGIKQIELVRLAEEKGIKLGKSHISQYVSGKTVPRKEILQFLAGVLEVEPDWLLGKAADSTQSSNENAAKASAQKVEKQTKFKANQNREQKINQKVEGNTMREFKKSAKLDSVLYDVRGPVVDEAARMEHEGTQVLKLNIGNPAPFGFRAPDEVIYDMRRQLTECEGYSDSKGLFSARKAIM